MDNQTLLSRIREQFPQAVRSSTEFRGALSIDIHTDAYLALATWLRDEPTLRYNFLENICGVDYLGRTPRFEVVAHLLSMQHLHRVCLKVGLP